MVLNQWVWKIFAVASPIRVFQNSPTFWGICSLALIYQGYSSHTCFFSHGDDSKKPEFTQIPFKVHIRRSIWTSCTALRSFQHNLDVFGCDRCLPTMMASTCITKVGSCTDRIASDVACRIGATVFAKRRVLFFCVATYWISCGGCFCWKIFFWWYLLPWYPWGRWSKFNFTTGAYVWYCSIRFLKLSKSFNHRI